MLPLLPWYPSLYRDLFSPFRIRIYGRCDREQKSAGKLGYQGSKGSIHA